jgi:hypothetical protein
MGAFYFMLILTASCLPFAIFPEYLPKLINFASLYEAFRSSTYCIFAR